MQDRSKAHREWGRWLGAFNLEKKRQKAMSKMQAGPLGVTAGGSNKTLAKRARQGDISCTTFFLKNPLISTTLTKAWCVRTEASLKLLHLGTPPSGWP